MASEPRVATTATEGVKILWEDKFFKTWQKVGAVQLALAKRENHFSPTALDMALKRAAHLTRRRKTGRYEYIQKYPYVADAGSNAVGKRGRKK